MSEPPTSHLLELTAQIVSAHVGHNSVHPDGVATLIGRVYAALTSVGQKQEALADRPAPAVPIKKSVFPDYIICLEDGKKMKMLRRHLHTTYNTTPEKYRERWGLPPDYPMVAPNYAARRSELAKQIGLGRRPALEAPPAAKRGRPRKTA